MVQIAYDILIYYFQMTFSFVQYKSKKVPHPYKFDYSETAQTNVTKNQIRYCPIRCSMILGPASNIEIDLIDLIKAISFLDQHLKDGGRQQRHERGRERGRGGCQIRQEEIRIFYRKSVIVSGY